MRAYRGGSVSQGDDASAERSLVCRRCQAPTAHATLASHGGQCYPCFANYVRTPARSDQSDSPTVREMKSRLRAREPGVQL